MTVKKSMQTSEGKKICSKYKRGHRNGGIRTTYVNPTPMSLPSLLLTKFMSNDVGVRLT